MLRRFKAEIRDRLDSGTSPHWWVYPPIWGLKISKFTPLVDDIDSLPSSNIGSSIPKTVYLLPFRSISRKPDTRKHLRNRRGLITVHYCGHFDRCTLPLHRCKPVETAKPCSKRGVFSAVYTHLRVRTGRLARAVPTDLDSSSPKHRHRNASENAAEIKTSGTPNRLHGQPIPVIY